MQPYDWKTAGDFTGMEVESISTLINEWAEMGFAEMAVYLAKYNDFRTYLNRCGR